MHKLSIVTVVDKNLNGLELLLENLEAVLSDDVEWVIKDSGRCQDTREWASRMEGVPNIRILCEVDSGIYDALNVAVAMADGVFYLTVGSDDRLFPDRIAEFVRDFSSHVEDDIVVYPVVINGEIRRRKKWLPLSVSTGGLIASHSVGTVIRKALHVKYGYYDTSYSILADSLFLTTCDLAGVRFRYIDKPMGEFDANGISSKPDQRRFLEAFRYQRARGSCLLIQVVLLILRNVQMFFGNLRRHHG